MKTAALIVILTAFPCTACAQAGSPTPRGSAPDALELLRQAAAVYAHAAPPFRIEAPRRRTGRLGLP